MLEPEPESSPTKMSLKMSLNRSDEQQRRAAAMCKSKNGTAVLCHYNWVL